MKCFLLLWKDEAGQDLTEYALLLVLIVLVAIASIQRIATAIEIAFNTTAADLAIST
jgi:Flp pilus assembly pilin Flp